jgi:hypothetical protein
MDIPHRVISIGRWFSLYFLMVEEICSLEVGSPEEWLRRP